MAYRGDVHPYVPVATELSRRGHEVVFVVPREFHPEFAAEPFACVHSGSDFSPCELDRHGEWIAKWGMRLGGVRILELYFGVFTVPHLDVMFEALAAALDGADVLFTHSTAAVVGSMAAESCGVPWISGDLFPMLIPTTTAPPAPNVPDLGTRGNALSWRVARSTRPNRMTGASDFMHFRARKGLRARRTSPIDLRISPHLNLGMVSPRYIEPAPDWPVNYHLTGFTHWGNDQGEMPDGLEEFLSGEDAPLLITLGTLAAAAHPERFTAAIEAADAANVRTISLCSMESTAQDLRSRVDPARHAVHRFAPLARVLPHVRGAVHSGSHGTNSMVLAAGLPSVVIPSIFDQVWHAKRQVELGTGLHAKKTRHLADAVRRLCTDPSIAANAQRFGALLSSEEDGTTLTADHIEGFLREP